MSKPDDHRSRGRYDCVFIGTSTISILEAVCQQYHGKRVLMIDDQPRVGGVWVSLDLFGLHEVENAIHYFLYDRSGLDFMTSVLRWEVAVTPRKYRILPAPFLGMRKIAYDNPLGLILDRLVECARDGGSTLDCLRVLLSATREASTRLGRPSHYLCGGAPAMMRSVTALLQRAGIDTLLSTTIDRVHLDLASETVRIGTSGGEILSRTIYLTHGSKLRSLSCDSGEVPIEQESHRRPQVHLLLRDASPSAVFEGIFVADPLIKYMHDVTRFTREAAALANRKKLLVVATQHDCEESENLYAEIVQRLKASGLIGADAALEARYWYESYLPALSTVVLERLQRRFSPLLETLKSENFCEALGLYSERWRPALS